MKSVKTMFVYGTLMSGERNHKYFKDSVIKIEEATVNGSVYHIEEQCCPTIELGDGICHGELITYQDPTGLIEKEIIDLELSFDGLEYTQEKTVAFVNENPVDIKVFCYPLTTKQGLQHIQGRWSEQK